MIKNKIISFDIKDVYQNETINWENFRNKTFYITGATGVIGSFLIRCLRYANEHSELNLKIVAGVRNIEKAKTFFRREKVSTSDFEIIKSDVTNPISYKNKIDYIIHCASNTASKSFIDYPVETFNVAVEGTKNILDFAKNKQVESVLYLSSMEVYGEINEPICLKESYLGKIDVLDPRSSYPMGKRAAEEFCYAYANEYNIPVKVVRLAQIIGANVDYSDSRVYAQFARSIVEKENIILNTPAKTQRSYCYISDLIVALLLVLVKGQNGECYNISNEKATKTISDIAKSLTNKYKNSKLVFDIKEDSPYAKETHWMLDSGKLKQLGWSAKVDIDEMYNRIINSFYHQKYKLDKAEEIDEVKIIKKKRDYSYDTFLEQIFSIKNKGKYKVLKLLGIPIKFDKTKLIKSYYSLPIQENKIVFSNYMGNGYGCNSKYIAEEILRRGADYDLVWLAKNNVNQEEIPHQFRVVNYKSNEALKELITAKIWVDNYHKISMIKKGLLKREGQTYIQTWHGALGIKKIEKQVRCLTEDKEWEENAIKNSQMTDYWISNSKFETFVYKDSFWDVKNENIKEFGHPRNDIFFSDSQKIIDKVKSYYNISKDKNILLYAPSFREDESLRYYQVDYKALQQVLEHKTNKQWIIMTRLHPRITKYSEFLLKNETNVIDVSDYADIQELLISSDAMITDYSSCIFDFMLTRKPAFIFAIDINEYNTERGFYYPIETTPFPISTTNEQLVKNIMDFNLDKYKKDVENFLQKKGCIEDGKASERVVDLIENILTPNEI